MHCSMTSDYKTGLGCPEPYLRRIAEAGFTHVHWCHQWNTDFLYDDCEVAQIARWLKELHLKLTDLHASSGCEKAYHSAREYERLAGVELVANRIRMTARLGCDVIILHLPEPLDVKRSGAAWDRIRRSLDALERVARDCAVRVAFENGQFDAIEKVLGTYGPGFAGLCYDSGHGNFQAARDAGAGKAVTFQPGGRGLDRLEPLKDRLISIHLHDNDGTGDQHKPIFSGTVDWERLARIIAASPYRKGVNCEATMKCITDPDEERFLAGALEGCRRFGEMIRKCRRGA